MSGENIREMRRLKMTTQLLAIIRYELLWNVRKKKLLGAIAAAFIITTLTLALPVIFGSVYNRPIKSAPNYVISNSGSGSLILFLFALVTTMNSISGEFESGTIIPLLAKPISRTLILTGKIIAAIFTVLAAYSLLYAYLVIGGIILYGPQDNLNLIPLCMLGDMLSTTVWMSIILATGALSKNTTLTTVIGVITFLAANIGTSIISFFTEGAWILHYFPGNGATGYIKTLGIIRSLNLSTGTDNIAKIIIQYMLNPSAYVTYVKIEMGGTQVSPPIFRELYSEPLSLVLFRALVVAATYITALLLLAWYAFKKTQVLE